LNWLGPSLILGGCPLAFGYGLHAFRMAPDRLWACVAMAVAGFELMSWSLMLLAVLPLAACAGALYGLIALIKKGVE
jgi:hypothetical protein